MNAGKSRSLPIPLTVLNSVPGLGPVPVEVEAMACHRPFWKGQWTLRLFGLDGAEIPCQEEQPEALLPFNDWRRKIVFMADLPHLGAAHFELRAEPVGIASAPRASSKSRFVWGSECENCGDSDLPGPWPRPLVVRDEGDSWGTGLYRYRDVVGKFEAEEEPHAVVRGPVRTIWESRLAYGRSRIVLQAIVYPGWPVIEYRLRILWNEEKRRLKLAVPLPFASNRALGEVLAGVAGFPADGEEYVHGRWLMARGKAGGHPMALGIVSTGQHGFDFAEREIRLSVLRSAAYCHERGFDLGSAPGPKFSDLGVHDVRLLMILGDPDDVRRRLPGLADWMTSPPFALAHLPIGAQAASGSLLSLEPHNIRMLACKRSEDGKALILRLQEGAGISAEARLTIAGSRSPKRLSFRPSEIKTLRLERDGSLRSALLITERGT